MTTTDTWHITCEKCGHKATREGGNEMVGTQKRLVCVRRGHRGATLIREPASRPTWQAEK